MRVTAASTAWTCTEACPWRTSIAPVGSTAGIGVPREACAADPVLEDASTAALRGRAENAEGAGAAATAPSITIGEEGASSRRTEPPTLPSTTAWLTCDFTESAEETESRHDATRMAARAARTIVRAAAGLGLRIGESPE